MTNARDLQACKAACEAFTRKTGLPLTDMEKMLWQCAYVAGIQHGMDVNNAAWEKALLMETVQ